MEHPENDAQYAGLAVNKGIEQPPTVNPYLKKMRTARRRSFTAAEYVEGIIKGNKAQKQTLTITNNGESKLTIHKVTNENRPLQVKLKRHTINPGKSAELTIEVDPSLARTNLLNCRVMLITDDPSRPSVPIRVLGSFE